MLHDNGSRCLIHYRAALASRDSGFLKSSLCLNRGESFIDEPDGDRGGFKRKISRESLGNFGSCPGLARQAQWQSDENLKRLIFHSNRAD